MKKIQNQIVILILICSFLLFPVSQSISNAHLQNSNDLLGEDTSLSSTVEYDSDVADIPTWIVEDSWVFQADIYSETTSGIFDISSDALTFYIEETSSIMHQDTLVNVYLVNISGSISGTFENTTISGDVSGYIFGEAIVRQADLSLITINISIQGIIEWFIFDFAFDIDSISTYYPSFEYFDFPLIPGEMWNSSATVHQNSSFYVETFYDNTSESTEKINGVVTCTGIEDIVVPAGVFSSYHILSEDVESIIESWYNTSVKNMVKFYLLQSNETSLNRVYLNLSSYVLHDQLINVTTCIEPQTANVGEMILISGSVSDSYGMPISDADVTILLPYSGDEYYTITNATGGYSIEITTPLVLDATNTSYDIGSDGVIVTVESNDDIGYTVSTLTVIGIGINNIHANPEIQMQSNPVNITCEIYAVESLVQYNVNISGPNGFTNQNVSLSYYNGSTYYLSQVYSIIGSYSFYIWAQDSIGNSNKTNIYSFDIISENETIDINQSLFDRGFPIRHAADGDWAGAQSFIPTTLSLKRADIYLRKFGNPEFDLTVDLRTNHPDGSIIDTLVFAPEEIPSSWTWFTLDFTDISITPGIEYFIVCPPAPSGVTTSFGYEWGYAFGNQYDDGAFWFTRDGGALWRDLPTSYEFTFRTYG